MKSLNNPHRLITSCAILSRAMGGMNDRGCCDVGFLRLGLEVTGGIWLNFMTRRGRRHTARTSADFEAAMGFAREVARQHPELCCEIYGHEGKTGQPLKTVYEAPVRGQYKVCGLGGGAL